MPNFKSLYLPLDITLFYKMFKNTFEAFGPIWFSRSLRRSSGCYHKKHPCYEHTQIQPSYQSSFHILLACRGVGMLYASCRKLFSFDIGYIEAIA